MKAGRRWCDGVGRLAVVALLAGAVAVVVPAAPGGADGNEVPGALPAFLELTAGGAHTCAVSNAGKVRCWGANGSGRLGLGDTSTRGDEANEMGGNLPAVDLGAGRTATAVSAGFSGTCALLDNGTVKCWGSNSAGQLGQGDTQARGDGPGEMGDNLAAVSLGAGRTATAISTGFNHNCALLDDGTVKCWGANSGGQLGQGDTTSRGFGANQMGDNLPPVSLGAGRTATAITTEVGHTCALLDNGTVKCWGSNNVGVLGLGDTLARGDGPNEMGDNLPAVDLGTGRTATAVTTGDSHTCALLDNATVKCWGGNTTGQLGAGDTSARGDNAFEMGDFLGAVNVGTGRTVTAITAAAAHTCARLDNNAVKCWGFGAAGQLGIGNTNTIGDNLNEMGDVLLGASLGTGRTATALTAGDAATCVRLDNGAVKCWGGNLSGQLGVGDTVFRGDNPNEMGDALPAAFLETPSGIAGTLTDSVSGAPVAGWVVVLRTTDFSIAGGGVADAMGQFSATLPAGSYALYLIDPAGLHAPGFFGAPTAVAVTTGAMTAVNPVIAPTRGSVTGTVIEDTTFNPVGSAWALVLGGTTGVPEAGAVANGAGQFSVPGLTPGARNVVLADPAGGHVAEFFPNSPVPPAVPNVVVSAGAATNASAALATQAVSSGASLTGRVTETGTGTRLPGAFVIALNASTLQMVKGAVTDAQGQYSMSVAPGPYKLGFIDPAGRHAMEWFKNQPASGLGSSASVTAPAVTNAALDASTGSIAGSVTAETGGAAVPEAWALAIGPNGIAGGAVTAANGTYSVTGLAPGSYRMAFTDPAGGGLLEYADDSPTYDDGTPFPVYAGNAAAVNAGLVFAGSDAFASARLLRGTAPTVSSSNVGAGKEVGEPNHPVTGGASVWFRWTAPAAGTMSFNTCGSSFDTMLAAYTGSAVGALTTVAANDDFCGFSAGSAIQFTAVAGRTYLIAVDGFQGATGDITLVGSFT